MSFANDFCKHCKQTIHFANWHLSSDKFITSLENKTTALSTTTNMRPVLDPSAHGR